MKCVAFMLKFDYFNFQVIQKMEEVNSNQESEYEEEQIHLLIQAELERIKLESERELKIQQDMEYQESLKKDTQVNPTFKEPSQGEMRRVRLLRFDKTNS